MSELVLVTDEDFTLSGVGTIPYTFDNWLTPSEGSSDSYDFESDNESFSVAGNKTSLQYTFDEPMETTIVL